MKKTIQRTSTLLLVAFVLFSACNKQSKKNSDTTVKAPKIDLNTAVITNDMEAVKAHIAADTDLNQKEPMGGSTPLITAAAFDKAEIAKLLIDAGADLNIANKEGSTALITAAFFCRKEIVAHLLDAGADQSIVNKYGQTALLTVAGPYEEVKPVYETFQKMFEPIGLQLDFEYLKETRPVIAEMLK